jgi:hypothetical protein
MTIVVPIDKRIMNRVLLVSGREKSFVHRDQSAFTKDLQPIILVLSGSWGELVDHLDTLKDLIALPAIFFRSSQ